MYFLNRIKTLFRDSALTAYHYKKVVSCYHKVKRIFPYPYSKWVKKIEVIPQNIKKVDVRFNLFLDAKNISEAEIKKILNNLKEQSFNDWKLYIFNNNFTLESSLLNENVKVFSPSSEFRFSKLKPDNDWVLFVNHAFLLRKHCLKLFSSVIKPSVALVYSDHDCLSDSGERISPNFKPDWNPDLFMTQEYISYCCIFNSKVLSDKSINDVPSCRNTFYDLIIEITTKFNKLDILHLPYVLFHRVKDIDALEAKFAVTTLREFIEPYIEVVNEEDIGLKLMWPLPTELPLVSLIIPTRNNKTILEIAVDSILNSTEYENFELLIVDNQSNCVETLEYLEYLSKNYSNIKIIEYDQPFNYSAINNYAVSQAQGTLVGFINNDIEVISPCWLTEMVSHALREGIGCVGAKLYYPDKTIQHAGVVVGLWGGAGHSHKGYHYSSRGYSDRLCLVQNYSAVTAAALVVKKSIFNSVGGFNEEHLPVAFNDVDLCLKIKSKGYRNLWTPYAELFHHESKSRGVDTTAEQLERNKKEISYLKDVWNTEAYRDESYNVNLSLEHDNFSLSRRRCLEKS